MRLLDNSNSSEDENNISWAQNGKYFYVRDTRALATKILPQYFNEQMSFLKFRQKVSLELLLADGWCRYAYVLIHILSQNQQLIFQHWARIVDSPIPVAFVVTNFASFLIACISLGIMQFTAS